MIKSFIKKSVTILTIITVTVLVYGWRVPKVSATIAYVDNSETSYNSATAIISQTISVNIGARTNGLLVVGIGIRGAFPTDGTIGVTGVTYGGVAMSQAIAQDGTASRKAYLYYLADPTDGTNDLVVSYSGDGITTGVSQSYILASWYDGAAQSSVLDQINSGTGTSQYPSVSVTPTQNNELVVSFGVFEHLSVLTPGETIINDIDAGAYVFGGSYVVQTTAGEAAMDWSHASISDEYALVVASFKEAAAEEEGPASTNPKINVRGGVKVRGGVNFR